jgi:seryl-tRNA synthetase
MTNSVQHGSPHDTAADGLATLGPETVRLRDALEQSFLRWATQSHAEPAIYPPLMRVAELAQLDYFRNFPHLAVMASEISDAGIAAGLHDDELESVACEHLHDSRYALPSAACFNIYLHLRGQTVEKPFYVTTAANCFRRETHFEGLRRLLGFYMREIVCVGERDAVIAHLQALRVQILHFTAALGLPVEIAPSSDPFFDPSAGRAVMAKLFPAKEEVTYGGDLAIASLNQHRNFFGERCEIRLTDGSHAFSGCVAFGLERWISALTTHFAEPPELLRQRVLAAASRT